jgi:hypothetical protein
MMTAVARNGYLYAPALFSLTTYNIQEPHAPWLVRNILLDFPKGAITLLAADGDTLYLGDRHQGLRVFDISEPDSPALSDWLPDTGPILQILANKGHMVLRTQGSDVMIYAIVKHHRLEERGSLPLKGASLLAGSALFENTRAAMLIHNLSNPDEPVVAASTLAGLNFLTRDQQHPLLLARRLSHGGNVLALFDITDPLKPVQVREIKLPATFGAIPADCVLQDNRLIFVDPLRFSLRIVDISGDSAKDLGQSPLMHSAGYIGLTEDHHVLLSNAYRTQSSLLQVDMDAQGPTSLTSLAMLPGGRKSFFVVHGQQNASKFIRLGNHILTGDGVVDIADLQHPRIVHPMTRVASGIATDDRHIAYLAQGDRLALLDVSALPAVKALGVFPTPDKKSRILDVLIQQRTAWVFEYAGNATHLLALDITDPATPAAVGRCDIKPAITGVIQGKYLYAVGVTTRGSQPALSIIDISDPAHPHVAAVNTSILQGDSYRAMIHDGLLYVADPATGIKALSLADPLHPVLVHTYHGPEDTSPAYTDFTFANDQLLGLRFSQIDFWKLAPAPAASSRQSH